MKKILLLFALSLLFIPLNSYAGDLASEVRGKILLQVESHGEAWYVDTKTGERTYMRDGAAAYQLMRGMGLGITNLNLETIPVMNDVHTLKELPSICSNHSLANSVKGEILLQVEAHGEAWYVYPDNCYRIYMKDGAAAYEIMRFLGLGITNNNLNLVPINTRNTELPVIVEEQADEVHLRGASDAKITIVEYCDLQGPFCRRVQETLDNLLVNYAGHVQLEFRHFPLSFHEHAQKAAEATECAADQGAFWQLHDLIYLEQELLIANGTTQLKAWATELALDRNQFDTCLDSGVKAKLVQTDFDQGERDGVTGTPQFYINGESLPGAQPYSAFEDIIERQLGNFASSGDHSFGAEDAPVVIIEYADFQCPFCRQANQTLDQLLNDYSGKVRQVYRHFPLSFHEHAQKAAEASECAADQGEFWLYHSLIYANQELLDGGIAQLKQWASDLNLNRSQFDTCLDSGAKFADVQADINQGKKDGVTGTPGFIINGELYHGALPYDVFAEIIESHLK